MKLLQNYLYDLLECFLNSLLFNWNMHNKNITCLEYIRAELSKNASIYAIILGEQTMWKEELIGKRKFAVGDKRYFSTACALPYIARSTYGQLMSEKC